MARTGPPNFTTLITDTDGFLFNLFPLPLERRTKIYCEEFPNITAKWKANNKNLQEMVEQRCEKVRAKNNLGVAGRKDKTGFCDFSPNVIAYAMRTDLSWKERYKHCSNDLGYKGTENNLQKFIKKYTEEQKLALQALHLPMNPTGLAPTLHNTALQALHLPINSQGLAPELNFDILNSSTRGNSPPAAGARAAGGSAAGARAAGGSAAGARAAGGANKRKYDDDEALKAIRISVASGPSASTPAMLASSIGVMAAAAAWGVTGPVNGGAASGPPMALPSQLTVTTNFLAAPPAITGSP